MSNVIIQNKKFLFVLCIISLIVRAVVFYTYLSVDDNYWQVDSKTYDLVARSIAQGNGISNDDGSYHFYRLPGYSLFLATCYRLFGDDHKNALWVQLLLASCIPFLIFLLALVLFPVQILIAKSAALYSCIHLGLVLYSGFFMTESLFLLFFLLFLILFLSSFCHPRVGGDSSFTLIKKIESEEVKKFAPCVDYKSSNVYEKSNDFLDTRLREDDKKTETKLYVFKAFWTGEFGVKTSKIFSAGIFLGIASLIRPVGQYVVILGLLLIMFSNDRWRKKITTACIFFVSWLIPVSWWLIRNFVVTGHIFFHTLPGGHFLYLSAARVAMYVHNTSYQGARELLHEQVERDIKHEEIIKGRLLYEIERCQVHERLAVKYFKLWPFITLKNWMTDIFRAVFSLYSAELLYLENGRKEVDYFDRGHGLSAMIQRYLFPQTSSVLLCVIVYGEIFFYFFLLLGYGLFFIQSIIDYLRYRDLQKMSVLFKTIPFIVLFIVIALSGGYARMRLPIEPLLIILSCAYWVQFKHTFL